MSYRIVSSYLIVSFHIASSYHFTLYYIIWISYHIISIFVPYHIISISCRIILYQYHIIPYPMIWYRYHVKPHHASSHHVISLHIISCHVMSQKKGFLIYLAQWIRFPSPEACFFLNSPVYISFLLFLIVHNSTFYLFTFLTTTVSSLIFTLFNIRSCDYRCLVLFPDIRERFSWH